MEEWVEFKAKTVNEALNEASVKFNTAKENLEYEVLEKESSGILKLFSKTAKIKARCKEKEVQVVKNDIEDNDKGKEKTDRNIEDVARKFLEKLFSAMKVNAAISIEYCEPDGVLNINIDGDDMGILIGKRGQTLDSLQYLTSLVVNKESNSYLKVKLDTENYRERRKETLENLAKNIAYKVKRTKHSVSLEPMNPYERRIIHSALQYDKYIETHSEGEEPYRHVVISLKKSYRDYNKSNHIKTYQREGRQNYSNQRINENDNNNDNNNV